MTTLSRRSPSGRASVSSLRQLPNSRSPASDSANRTRSVLPSSHQRMRSSSGMPSSAASVSWIASPAWAIRWTLPLAQSISILSILSVSTASPTL